MKKLILIIMMSCSLFGLKAQDPGSKRFIEVTGVDETEITPDEIILMITLVENKENGPIQKQEDELKRHLKELGIDLSNLTLNSADADYQKVRAFKKDVVISKSYRLKVSNADMVAKVYERLDKMNANDAYILKVTYSKMTELKKESRIKAIKAAKDKVDYLLAAVGEKAGQPLQINEVEMYTPVYANTMMKRNAAADDGGEISFKKITVRSSVMVKYEIISK